MSATRFGDADAGSNRAEAADTRHDNQAASRDASRAAADAMAVVGLYGDPTVTWSIAMEAELTRPIPPEQMRAGLAELVAVNPQCGSEPGWQVVEDDAWQDALDAVMNQHYSQDGPIVRGAADRSGRRVVVGGHHGAVDGLGMLALLGAAVGADLRSHARGISSAPADRSFLRAGLERVKEVVLSPPCRFAPDRHAPDEAGDWIVSAQVPGRIDTSRMVTAITALVQEWNEGAMARRPVIIAIGASRREPGIELVPDRDTAYLRIVSPSGTDLAVTKAQLAATAPEPDFPASTGGGIGPIITKVLANRLGSTALVSNMAVVRGGEELLKTVRLYPAPSGPSGVAVGAISNGTVGTMTLRARRRDFSQVAAQRLLDRYLELLAQLQA
ncbi:hypothetical protein ACMYYO_08265 [Dermacoccaceae bacterium W4C1]